MPKTINHKSSASKLIGTSLILTLLLTIPALAQDPVVNSADPSSAEQETLDLVVMVGGDNFGSDSEVDFFVSGTEDPGGIHVKNVKRQGPKTLRVTIDVDAGATVDDFDIQVQSRGRSGKGIELFRVLEKTHPTQDDIPPNDVPDLALIGVPELTPEGDYRVQLDWTSPADPPLMSAATEYWLKARPASSFTPEDWEENNLPTVYLGPNSHPYPPESEWPGTPGSTESHALRFLAPNTVYTVALRSVDANLNWSGISNTVMFQTGPKPQSDWVVEVIDSCPPGTCYFGGGIDASFLAFGPDGSPTVFYVKKGPGWPYDEDETGWVARWTSASWSYTPFEFPLGDGFEFDLDPAGNPVILTTDPGPRSVLRLHRLDGNSWTSEEIDRGKFPYGQRGLAAYAQGDVQLLAAAYRPDSKGKVRLALWDGESWEKHDVSSSWKRGDAVVAFDHSGRPAIAYQGDSDRNGETDTLHFALWNGASWESEVIDVPQDPEYSECALGARLQWNAEREEFWAAHHCVTSPGTTYSQRVRICSQDPGQGTWQCTDLPESGGIGSPSLAFDPWGTAYLTIGTQEFMTSGYSGHDMLRLWRRNTLDPASEWSSEVVDWSWGYSLGNPLRFDPVSNELGVVNSSTLRPDSPLRLLRKQLP